MNVALDLKPEVSGLGVYMFIKLFWLINSSFSIYLQINHTRTQIVYLKNQIMETLL